MLNKNSELPPSVQGLFENIKPLQGVPLGTNNEMPIIALKVSDEVAKELDIIEVRAEFKPTVMNVDVDGSTLAILFVQFKLNGNDNLIFTLSYDLNNPKHYIDAYGLLKMQQYTLIIGTSENHKVVSFTTNFEAKFQPVSILEIAKSNATEYGLELFHQITSFIITTESSQLELWKHFDRIAPLERSWYTRMTMQK
jgi:hypothetical protein